MQFGIFGGEDSIVIDGIVWNKYTVQNWLGGNDLFLEKAIMYIYERQDADEQSSNSTNKENGRGFNKDDSYILSMYAQYIKKRTTLELGKRLTFNERLLAREKMHKYAGQVLKVIIEKQKAKKVEEKEPIAIGMEIFPIYPLVKSEFKPSNNTVALTTLELSSTLRILRNGKYYLTNVIIRGTIYAENSVLEITNKFHTNVYICQQLYKIDPNISVRDGHYMLDENQDSEGERIINAFNVRI